MADRKRLGLRVETGPNTQKSHGVDKGKSCKEYAKDETSDGILSGSVVPLTVILTLASVMLIAS